MEKRTYVEGSELPYRIETKSGLRVAAVNQDSADALLAKMDADRTGPVGPVFPA